MLGSLGNVPRSAWKNLGQPVVDLTKFVFSPTEEEAAGGTVIGSPISTAINLARAAQKIGPQDLLKAVIEDYKQAYGGAENIERTLTEDPVRVALDMATPIGPLIQATKLPSIRNVLGQKLAKVYGKPAAKQIATSIIPAETGTVLNTTMQRPIEQAISDFGIIPAQAGGGQRALAIASKSPEIENILAKQREAVRATAQREFLDPLGITLGESRGQLAQRVGEYGAKKRTDVLKSLGEEHAAIAARINQNKINVPVGTKLDTSSILGPDGQPITTAIPQFKELRGPIELGLSKVQAQNARNRIDAFADSFVANDLVNQQFNKVKGLLDAILDNPTKENTSKLLGDFDTLEATRRAIDDIRTEMPRFLDKAKGREVNNILTSVRDALGTDITRSIRKSNASLGERYEKYLAHSNQQLSKIATPVTRPFMQSKADISGAAKALDPESGISNVLGTDQKFSKFTAAMGTEKGREVLLSEMFRRALVPGTQGLNAGAMTQFMAKNPVKFRQVMDSTQRAGLTRFVRALEAQNRGDDLTRLSNVMSNEGRGAQIRIGAGLASGYGYAPIAGAAQEAFLWLDSKVMSKLLTNPKFSFAAADLMGTKAGTLNAAARTKNMIKFLGKANVPLVVLRSGKDPVEAYATGDGKIIPLETEEEIDPFKLDESGPSTPIKQEEGEIDPFKLD